MTLKTRTHLIICTNIPHRHWTEPGLINSLRIITLTNRTTVVIKDSPPQTSLELIQLNTLQQDSRKAQYKATFLLGLNNDRGFWTLCTSTQEWTEKQPTDFSQHDRQSIIGSSSSSQTLTTTTHKFQQWLTWLTPPSPLRYSLVQP